MKVSIFTKVYAEIGVDYETYIALDTKYIYQNEFKSFKKHVNELCNSDLSNDKKDLYKNVLNEVEMFFELENANRVLIYPTN